MRRQDRKLRVEYLLDASALLAFLRREPGADKVEPLLPASAISAVNLAEVFTKAVQKGLNTELVEEIFADLGIPVLTLTSKEVQASLAFAKLAWENGLSLGDRLCLATAATHGLIVLTADRQWPESTAVQIQKIR